ncbi:hypothetical protein [Erwinia oleae]|uniref:hypothetical protein n=1 Tax=Erwinia oleae TaxID=796334 RepID=UPI0005550575|nr:hypothetical protein [Erwinia oleae]
MKKQLLILIVVALTGCSSAGPEKEAPGYAAHSIKSAYEFNKCLAPQWLALNPASASVAGAKGYRITASGAVDSVATIEMASDGGADVKIYTASKDPRDRWIASARSCM